MEKGIRPDFYAYNIIRCKCKFLTVVNRWTNAALFISADVFALYFCVRRDLY